MFKKRNRNTKEKEITIMLATIAEILFAALLLIGVLKREKLIAFERALSDYAARRLAAVVRRRRADRARKARALQAQQRRAALHAVRGCSAPTGRFIA